MHARCPELLGEAMVLADLFSERPQPWDGHTVDVLRFDAIARDPFDRLRTGI